MTRETVYAALFSKLQNITGIITASRRLRHWSDMSPAQQPALFLTQVSETAMQTKGLPPKWTLRVNVALYVNVGNDETLVPSSLINPLIDKVEAALAPLPGGFQTLGGLVSHCWIADTIETDEGLLGPQAVAIIPINILTS
jgi:hypothetical protein